jgi:hypothetical protein
MEGCCRTEEQRCDIRPFLGGAGVGHARTRTNAPDENIKLEDFVLGMKNNAVLLTDFNGRSKLQSP